MQKNCISKSKIKLKNRNNILYLFFLALMILVLAHKRNMCQDEILTYMLANSSTGYMAPIDGQTYSPADKIWIETMAVHENTILDYVSVWANQAGDVHPPFYYMILHALSSLYPNRFSIWYAGSINIFFALLTLWVLRRLIYKLTENKDAVIWGSIFFVLSAGILVAVSFLRMYVMVMFEVTYLTYLFIKSISEKRNWKFFVSLLIISTVGALTHYYFIVYLFFICLLFGIYLLMEKKWKEVGIFITSMLLSAGISVAIFPAMIRQMFANNSPQRQTTLENLQATSVFDYGHRLKTTYNYIDSQLFGGLLLYILTAVLFFKIYSFLKNREMFKEQNETFVRLRTQWLFMILPGVGYFFIISKMAVWVADRYFFPIYPIIIILVITLLYSSGKIFLTEGVFQMVLLGILTVMLVNSWKICGWQYLYRDSELLLKKSEQYCHVDNVYIYDENWKAAASFCEISNYKSVTFFHNDNKEALKNLFCRNNEELVVTIDHACDAEKVLNEIISVCPLLDYYEEIGSYAYATSYYLTGPD